MSGLATGFVLIVVTCICAAVTAQERPAESGTVTRPSAAAQPDIAPQRPAADDANAAEEPQPEYHTGMLRGRVMWLSDALKKRFGISTVGNAKESGFALVTADDELIPLVENLRGRAFRKDDRLRNMELELLVRRYPKQPFVQILRIFEVDDGKHYEVDYWCDVCAIIMFELGPCSCCQDDNRIRKRLIDEADLRKLVSDWQR